MMETRLLFFHLSICLFLNLLVAQPVQRPSTKTEWHALLDLRGSLGISGKVWPRRANPCSNWTGIECKSGGNVIGINLSGLRRTRQGKQNPRFAVDSLSKFTSLSTFNASGFLLKGPIPVSVWLGQGLSNLEVLDLRSCSISGSIPASIGSLGRLKTLFLSNNNISGSIPPTLGNLSSLSVLDLSRNSLTGELPSELSGLRNLSKLDLSSNFLVGGITLNFSSLSRLESLNLSNNSLSSIIPADLANLSQLMELDLGSNSLIGSLSKSFFQKRKQLKYLDVSANRLTGFFPNLTNVNATGSTFNLSGNHFYGNLSSWIGRFQIIDLSNNYFRGSAPNETVAVSINLTQNCFPSVQHQRDLSTCNKFYSDRSLSPGNGRDQGASEPPPTERGKSRKRLPYIMVGVFGGLGFLIVLISLVLLLLKACKSVSTENQRENRNVKSVAGDTEQPPKVLIDHSSLGEAFTFEQMLLATGHFSNKNLIKRGYSGDLFRGILQEEHQVVVVKRIDLHSIRKESFMSELAFLGKVSHPRFVPLVGHCLDHEHVKILVYKYMPNGDLSNALYRLTNADAEGQSLDWITRLKIATGAAEALSYLHHECTPPLVHRDIQASSILLDDLYEVRIGSFGEVCTPGASNHQNVIARLLHAPGTSGERHSGSSSPSITCAYDVYCFGKVLLELVTGRLGISRLNNDETKQWLDNTLRFITMHDKEMVMKIVDQSLIIDEDLLEEVWAVAIVAKSCLNPKSSKRPSARQVLKALENPFKVVREETFSSAALRTTSSRKAWTAAFFGSWHRSSSDSSSRSGPANRTGSRGSGVNDHSSSHKRSSSDVFPEPGQDVEKQDGNS